MSRARYILSGLAVFGWAGAATAQSLPGVLNVTGRLAAGVTDRVPGADIFLFGDATARLSFGPFGAEIGAFGLADALDTPHETYGALTFDLARGGRVALGVPRPAYDSFAISALEGPFPSLGVARTGVSRSQVTAGAMFANFLPYGLRFENGAGAAHYDASVHAVPNQDLTVAGFGLGAPVGPWTLEGAVEVVWGGASTDVAAKLQAQGQAGPVSGGVGIYAPAASGAAESVEVFGAFEAGDRVTVSGAVQVPLSRGADPSAGAAVRYRINDRVDLSAGVLSDAGAEAAFNAVIDFRF